MTATYSQKWYSIEVKKISAERLSEFLESSKGLHYLAQLREHREFKILGRGNVVNGDDRIFYIDGRGLRQTFYHQFKTKTYREQISSHDKEILPQQLIEELSSCGIRPPEPDFIDWLCMETA